MKKINNYNLVSLMIIILFTTTYGEGIYVIIKGCGVDAYFSVILSIIFAIPSLYIFNVLFNYEPDLNLFEKNKKLFKFSFIPNFIVIVFALLIGSIQMFNLTNFLVSQFLSETSPLIISLIFCFLMIYLLSKDLSCLARISSIFLGFNFILFFISIIGLFNQVKLNNLFPILENGLYSPFICSFKLYLINICPLFFLLLIPKNKVINFSNKSVCFSYFIYILLSLFMIVLTIGTLGINLSKLYQYPEYIVLRRINFLDFLTRIENLLFTEWIFGLFTLMAFSAFTIKENFKFRFSNCFVCFGILILSLCFSTLTIFNDFMFNIYHYIGFGFMIYILICFIKTKKIT